MTWTTTTLKKRFLEFFAAADHAVVRGAPLLPDNDPSVLFTTAGMHPLVPYLSGQPHSAGRRITNVQRCLRTGDIDEVGDSTHLTVFDMLGSWSLGNYGRHEAIALSHEFLTDVLGISPDRLHVTVHEDDPVSADVWRSLGVRRIALLREDNWWGLGEVGPCGPCTEMFFDTTGVACGVDCGPGTCGCDRFVEIWNDVFLEHERRHGELRPLAQRCVDTGMGLERTVSVLNGCDLYDVDGLAEVLDHLRTRATVDEPRALRILTDHLRASVSVLTDPLWVEPSNKGAGYVLRRLIRRSIRMCGVVGLSPEIWVHTAELLVESGPLRDRTIDQLDRERGRFEKTLRRGTKLLLSELPVSPGVLSGKVAFQLFDTFGLPVELTTEIAEEHGVSVDLVGFETELDQHRERSRGTVAKSGLADDDPRTVRYHTATHLLHAVLRDVLGEHVEQRGSNLTAERLRFDFSHDRALTPEELRTVEERVQSAIDADLQVLRAEMSVAEAEQTGALGLFNERYDAWVSTYRIGEVSLEICAGPHVSRTGELGRFSIVKQQSVGSGVRRIRATLSDR